MFFMKFLIYRDNNICVSFLKFMVIFLGLSKRSIIVISRRNKKIKVILTGKLFYRIVTI